MREVLCSYEFNDIPGRDLKKLNKKLHNLNLYSYFPHMEKNHYYIDLFAGCGGLSLGLANAGWKGLFAIEKNRDAFLTLKHNLIDKKKHFNWPSWLPLRSYDINYFINKYKNELIGLNGKIDLVVGGPPCQGFSTAGAREEDDKRNKLVHSYIKFIRLVKPKLIFFENVKGFTFEFKKKNQKGKTYSDEVIVGLKKLGYKLEYEIINFAEYGIPQIRNRFILVGKHDESMNSFFDELIKIKEKLIKERELNNPATVGEAISDLHRENGEIPCPDSRGFYSGLYADPPSMYQKLLRSNIDQNIITPDSHRFAKHKKEIKKQFAKILKFGGPNKKIDERTKKKYKVRRRSLTPLSENLPCPVLTSLPDEYIHYKEPRILTVREYARIQSFPDWYEIKGKYTTGGPLRKTDVPRYTQLANAIPPLFAEQCGYALKEII